MATERSIVNGIMQRLRERGAKAFKMHGGTFHDAGRPDVWILLNGTWYLLEAKQPNKYPTKLQKHELDDLEQRRAYVAVVRSASEAVTIIEQHQQGGRWLPWRAREDLYRRKQRENWGGCRK